MIDFNIIIKALYNYYAHCHTTYEDGTCKGSLRYSYDGDYIYSTGTDARMRHRLPITKQKLIDESLYMTNNFYPVYSREGLLLHLIIMGSKYGIGEFGRTHA